MDQFLDGFQENKEQELQRLANLGTFQNVLHFPLFSNITNKFNEGLTISHQFLRVIAFLKEACDSLHCWLGGTI
jgi:hypothetical protein